MAGVNKAILVGRLGKDPDVRHLESGASVANFPMATSETYKDKQGNKVENTEWHNVVLWRGLSEIAEKYLKKGSQVYIEGKLKTRSWEKDGITRYTTEVVGDQMTMLDTKNSNNGNQGQQSNGGQPSYNNNGGHAANNNNAAPAQQQAPNQPNTGSELDDLPF